MSTGKLAADSERYCFSEAGRLLYWPERAPRANLQLFLHNGLFADAIRYLADLLPKRVAVWWGCQCVWEALRSESSEEAEQTLAAVLQWVVDPTEARREAVQASGHHHQDLDTPWACLAMAVTWSGGSLNGAGLPVLPPPEHATARAVAGAVLLAAVFRDPLHYEHRYRRFLDLGMHIAQRRNLWPEIVSSLVSPGVETNS